MASHMARLPTLGRAAALLLRSRQCGSCSRSVHASRLLCSKDSTQKSHLDNDFFGIGEEETDVDRSDSTKSSALPMDELEKKYAFRRQDVQSKNYEQILETSFGQVRLDHARTTKRKDRLGLLMASQFAQNIKWRRQGLERGVSEAKEIRSQERRGEDKKANARKKTLSADNAQASPRVGGVHQHSDTSFSGAHSDTLVKQNSKVNIFDEQYFNAISHTDMDAHATGTQTVGESNQTSHWESSQKRAQPTSHEGNKHGTHGTDSLSLNRTSPGSDFIDDQYFDKILEKSDMSAYSEPLQDQDKWNIFEEQYFGNAHSTETNGSGMGTQASFRLDREDQSTLIKSQSLSDRGIDTEPGYFSSSASSDATAEAAGDFMTRNADSPSEPAFDSFVSDLLSPLSQPPAKANSKPLSTDSSVSRERGMQEPPVSQSVSKAGSRGRDARMVRITRPQQPLSVKEVEALSSATDARTAVDTSAVTGTSFATDTWAATDSAAAATDELDTNTVGQITKRGRKEMERVKVNTQRPQTAYDMALKIRKELKEKGRQQSASADSDEEREVHTKFQGPVDSKGFRILKSQVPSLSDLPSSMVVSLLKDSIIYNKGDIVAIDKPYGLPSHDGPGQRLSVGGLLPELAHLLDRHHPTPSLHLVHSLDRDTTGVLLLARSQQMALQLTNMFRRQEVIRRFWVLTKGVPDPREGIIDIPIYEGKVNGVYRRALLPPFTKETKLVMQKSSREALPAMTRYRVLDSNSSAALVLVQPLTGIKHQVRVHLAFGLNTPILGDHKYSHFSRIAPQKLYAETLQRLGIRQSKVCHLPMHLHAHSLVVPELLDGTNLFLTARLPRHFSTNMKRLKIKPPSGRQELEP